MKARSSLVILALSLALTLVLAAPASASAPQVTDLASPTHPDQWGTYYSNDPEFTWSASPGPYGWCDTPGCAWGVAVAGGFAYVADWGGGLQVVDVSNPASPAPRGSYWGVSPFDIDVVGTTAYLAFWNGLQVVDVTNPDDPIPHGTYWTPDWGMDVEVAGSYAYVPADTQGMRIIDVSDIDALHEEGAYAPGGQTRGVDVQGDYAYLARGWAGLAVVSVADPANPVEVGTLGVAAFADQVIVAGDYAYVTATDEYVGERSGLHIIDISDPAAPLEVGFCPTGGSSWYVSHYPYGIVLDGSTAYVANGDSGVLVIDVGVPTAPAIVKTLPTEGNATGLSLDSGLVYVADDQNGLAVLDPNAVASDPEYSYSFCIDQAPDTAADEIAEGTTAAASFTDLANGTWWFHVRAADAGVWGPTAHFEVNIDHRPHITSLSSITHYWGEWSANNDPQFEWLTDVSCDAYSYAIGRYDEPEPDTGPDPVENVVHPSVTLTDVPDGEWWFRVRARDLEGNWGPMAEYFVRIKANGPTTMAVATKTTKRGVLYLQYSVHDIINGGWGAPVVIEIRSASGVIVRTIDCGWRQLEVVWSVAVTPALPRGRYTYTVHAWDWLGNPESQAGTAAFIVR